MEHSYSICGCRIEFKMPNNAALEINLNWFRYPIRYDFPLPFRPLRATTPVIQERRRRATKMDNSISINNNQIAV